MQQETAQPAEMWIFTQRFCRGTVPMCLPPFLFDVSSSPSLNKDPENIKNSRKCQQERRLLSKWKPLPMLKSFGRTVAPNSSCLEVERAWAQARAMGFLACS